MLNMSGEKSLKHHYNTPTSNYSIAWSNSTLNPWRVAVGSFSEKPDNKVNSNSHLILAKNTCSKEF